MIGPNNSGKTNVLKALVFFSEFIKPKPDVQIPEADFKRNIHFKKGKNKITSEYSNEAINFLINISLDNNFYFYQIGIKGPRSFSGLFGINISNKPIKDFFPIDDDLQGLDNLFAVINTFSEYGHKDSYDLHSGQHMEWRAKSALLEKFRNTLYDMFQQLSIYKLDPGKFTLSGLVSDVKRINADGSNIVSFLFNLSHNYKKRFRALEDDIRRCVGDIEHVSTPSNPVGNGTMKLKFFDVDENEYWADEVSEGVLYFLALLCIIHQPDPPKLLLLEEPEKGIHPRRIQEVSDFIFDLAQEKEIQVIMTTHDTYMVDQFADIPEAVFVFDKRDGATEVKNLQKDIIEPADRLYSENGLPPTNYTRSLGEHWAAGFLGGVPR